MKHLLAAVTGLAMLLGGSPEQAPAPQNADTQGTAAQQTPGGYTLSVNANIVLTNVVVRDRKTGALVKGLKASDFQIFEDGKPQKIASFDYENVDEAATLAEKTVTGKASIADLIERTFGADPRQAEGPSPDRSLLRPQLDAGRGHRSRCRRCEEVREREDAARRPRRHGEHVHRPDSRPGLYLRQECSAARPCCLQRR